MEVDEEDEAVDNADEDATGVGELDSSHIPLPTTNVRRDNPRRRTLEEYPHLREGAADAEEPVDIPHPMSTSVITIGTPVTAADLMCPVGTTAKLARGRAGPATMMRTNAGTANNTLTRDMRPLGAPGIRSTCLSLARRGANDY